MKCRYPDKPCIDRYASHPSGSGEILKCRLAEWKRKQGTCPHDKTIKAHARVQGNKAQDKAQRRLQWPTM